MLFLLDANAVSDLMGNHPRVVDRLSRLGTADRVVTCPIVLGEILFGIGRLPPGRRRGMLEAQAHARFLLAPVEPMTAAAGEHYARIKLARQRVGRPMDENDLWIAATALALGAVLVTRDAGFAQVPGLAVEDWTA